MTERDASLLQPPDAPGVYLFKDREGRILYVGKAASLRKRVASYFSRKEPENPRLARLRSQIHDADYIVTANEVEALILEANLIKRFRPPYNIDFRDDKSYPYLVICTGDRFPRVMFTRGRRFPDALYYGPYAHAGAVRETLDTLRKVFPFRACRGREPGKGTGGPCLDYHIRLCCGPCTGRVSQREYAEIIESVREFLEGDHERILSQLRRRMQREAERQEFELAARTRDKIVALQRILEKQQAHSLKEGEQDIVGVHRGDLDACVTVFFVRSGKLLGKKDFVIALPASADEGEILADFLPLFYSGATFIPREIVVSHELDTRETELLQDWLSGRKGRRVRIVRPRRGEKRRLVEKVLRNARLALEMHLAKQASDLGWISRAVEGIQRGLGLPRVPYRIEGYDVSNLGGRDCVGSMVVFEGGIPRRRDYRRFTIKSTAGHNDPAMIGEVLRRRMARLSSYHRSVQEGEEGKGRALDSFHRKPDLILVDGGKPQLSAALKALEEAGFSDICVASLAKRMEEIHLPGRREPVVLPRDSEALHLLQRIRDEAHRYGISHHRQQRKRRTRKSVLDDIPGVGPKRKRMLLRHYGSVAAVLEASLEELSSLSFLDRRTAENIHRALRGGTVRREET
jgi:excinuclease ABC subunit C